ncbi:actin depolymerizing protein [Meredithblackwellia eburnea MCA 4105]
MTTQSGITASASLHEAWSEALADPQIRIFNIAIEGERIVPAGTVKGTSSFEDDFGLITVETDKPAYILLRLDQTPDSQWVFYSYVPDAAPVRSKMLYASTRATLLKALGDSHLSTSVFATDKSDLTSASLKSHLSHVASDAPLTAREQEMAEIKAAERTRGDEGVDERAGHPAWSGAVGLGWDNNAKELVEKFSAEETDGGIIRLEVDTKKELVIPSEPQPSGLELPAASPAYTFYRHSRGVVFIYSCPPTSPIKSRLLYSSSVGGVLTNAKTLGLEVAKKIETSSPEEVNESFIDEEFGPSGVASAGPASGTATPTGSTPLPAAEGKSFARPARPGRKR